MPDHIALIRRDIPVAGMYWALQSHPDLWDRDTMRTEHPESPHRDLSDIWCRYAPRVGDDYPQDECVWYDAAMVLPVKPLVHDIFRFTEGVELGGVLITRIPQGAKCHPHTDTGWHAKRYEKFAVQITSAPGQMFCFEGEALETKPGDLFWFDNAFEHWVENDTPYERITMIVGVRRGD